jgi:hypothetical protein
MRYLTIGDIIDVKNGVFEPVYSFGHHEPAGRAKLLEIRASDEALPVLQISRRHLVFVDKSAGPVAIPATAVQVGDRIVLSGDSTGEGVQL